MSSFVLASLVAALTPQNLWSAWSFDPAIVVPLEVMSMVYAWGLWKVWRRAGMGHGISVWRSLAFLVAILALVVALVSPLDALSGDLFAAHMTQHLILIMVAAPLLVMSDLPLVLLWALPHEWAQALGRHWTHTQTLERLWRGLSHPVSAWLFFTIALWGWHAPALFEAALRNNGVHAVEHVALLLTAVLFWWVLLGHSGPSYVRYGLAIPYLFATTLQSSLLGALMTFTAGPWYAYYASRVAAWGVTLLQDQQLAGLIMWLPGGVVFTLLTIGYFAAWLRALEQRSARRPPPYSLQTERPTE